MALWGFTHQPVAGALRQPVVAELVEVRAG
jgi:hypothetical protein